MSCSAPPNPAASRPSPALQPTTQKVVFSGGVVRCWVVGREAGRERQQLQVPWFHATNLVLDGGTGRGWAWLWCSLSPLPAAGTVLAPLGLILLIYVVLLVPSLVQRQQQQLVHTPHQAAQRHVRQLGSRAGQLSTLQVIF